MLSLYRAGIETEQLAGARHPVVRKPLPYVFAASRTVGLMPKLKIRLQVNVAVAAEAKGRWVGEGFQVAVCTGVVEQAF